MDPLSSKLPSLSPYSYAANNPISFIDYQGLFPYPVTIRSFHPHSTFGGGFGGDSRGFYATHNPNITSRVSHTVIADAAKGTVVSGGTFSNESHHPILGTDQETPSSYISGIESSGSTLSFETGYEGTNPLTPGAPAIDILGNFSITEDIDAGILTISAQISGDDFPNTEAFIADPSGQSVFIGVDVRSGSDKFPSKLFGGATEQIMNTAFQIRIDGKGNFQGVHFAGKDYNVVDWNNMFFDKNPDEGR